MKAKLLQNTEPTVSILFCSGTEQIFDLNQHVQVCVDAPAWQDHVQGD